MIKGIFGLNIAVGDFEEAVKRFQKVLNVKPVYLKDEEFAFPNLVGAKFCLNEVCITVIGSRTSDTSIAKFLERRGEGIFLLSLLVDDIERDIEKLKQEGLRVVRDIKEVAQGKLNNWAINELYLQRTYDLFRQHSVYIVNIVKERQSELFSIPKIEPRIFRIVRLF